MGQFTAALITGATTLAVILAADLGDRRVTAPRTTGPVLAVAVAVVLCVHSFPASGNDLSLQLACVGVGVICGLIAGSLLPARRESSGEIHTVGGIGYALIWLVLATGQTVFAYGAEHWFTARMTRFTTDYDLSGDTVLVSSAALMTLAMAAARTAVLLSRARALRAAGADSATGSEPDPVPGSGAGAAAGGERRTGGGRP
ncbi:hypothetical protein [Streptomyces sp. NPDC020141]|uniref:hypothetical protein n=1 Tax=Streptomyces sp. NPDC020141 TaxID=3365065 RepID=UPI00379BE75A